MLNLRDFVGVVALACVSTIVSIGCNPETPLTKPGKLSSSSESGKPNLDRTDAPAVHPNPDLQDLTPRKGEAVVKGSTFKNDLVEVTIEGVCRITEDSVACWNVDGAPNRELAQEIEAGLTSQPNRITGLQLQYKKKNRALVVKTTTAIGVNVQPGRETAGKNTGPNTVGWNGMRGSLFNAYSTDFSNRQTRREVQIGSFAPDDKIGSYRIEYSKMRTEPGGAGTSPSLRIEAKAGGQIRIGDVEVKLKSVGPTTSAPFGNAAPPGMKLYQYVFEVGNDPYLDLNFNLLDESGRRLYGMSNDGKPYYSTSTPSSVVEYSKTPMRPNMGGIVYPVTQLSPSGERTMTLTTALGPTMVKKFEIGYQRRNVVFFDNIPLDPK